MHFFDTGFRHQLTQDQKSILEISNYLSSYVKINRYDVLTLEKVEESEEIYCGRSRVKFSPDSRLVLCNKAGAMDGMNKAMLYDLNSKQALIKLETQSEVETEEPYDDMVFSKSVKTIAAYKGTKIYIWDISDLTARVQNADSMQQ